MKHNDHSGLALRRLKASGATAVRKQRVSTVSARAAVCLSLPPTQGMVGKVAAWLTSFCELTLDDAELASRVHMAAYELVENVLKYGEGPEIDLELELVRCAQAATLRLTAHNTAKPERVQEVVRRIRELKSAADPVAYYDRLVRETAPLSDRSGLGLARIAVEGYLGIDVKVEGQRLSIEVKARLDQE
jgi:hypothetical protein